MALLYFVDTIIHYIRHKSKHFNPHFFKTTNQSLSNQLNWTKIGEVTGSSTIQLPSSFNELYIEVNTGGSSWHEIFNIPFVALTEQSKDYFNGFYSSSANSSMVQISVNKKYC